MKKSFKKRIDSELPVLVYFFSSWCTSCILLTPILQQVKDDLGDGLIFIEIDVDLAPSLVKKYKVRGMPTLIIFKNKEPLWRHSGMIQKVDLETIIRDYS